MKKLALYILFIFGALLIPTIATILISGNMGVADIKMGITVEMKNGEKMDGEQFVIGMAASELSYIKEEEALKAWMIVCRTNFVKAAFGESNSKKVGSETDITVAQKTRNIANAASTQNSANTTNVVGIQNSDNIKGVQSTEIINRKYQNIRQENINLDYISMKELEENNGRKAYLEIKKRLEDASDATFGQVLIYQNKYADALYHEVSIGKQFLQKKCTP